VGEKEVTETGWYAACVFTGDFSACASSGKELWGLGVRVLHMKFPCWDRTAGKLLLRHREQPALGAPNLSRGSSLIQTAEHIVHEGLL
jgi:hypothetical protein